jgi:predicted SprT family Zn-dependent metalloprotease
MNTTEMKSTQPTKPEVSCAGGCGQKVEEPSKVGWDLLPITGRYRCGSCTRALRDAGRSHN